MPQPRELVADAIKAIDIIGDPKTSEIAGLFTDPRHDEFRRRISNLRNGLEREQRHRSEPPSP